MAHDTSTNQLLRRMVRSQCFKHNLSTTIFSSISKHRLFCCTQYKMLTTKNFKLVSVLLIIGFRKGHTISATSTSTTSTSTTSSSSSSSDQESEHSSDQGGEHESAFQLGSPVLRGSGCPSAASVGIMSTSDGSKISVLFEDYWAETGSRRRVRKGCALAIPVKVAPGYSIGILQADYRGYVDVPHIDGCEATFNTEYFFAGTWGEKQCRTWEHGEEGDFTLTDRVGTVAMSPCGQEEHILRVNTSILARTRGLGGDSVLIQIDSGDFTNPFRAHIPLDELGPMFSFDIHTKRCSATGNLRTFQP